MDEYKSNGNSNLEYLDKHNFKRLVLALLSINYLIEKFDALTQKVTGNADILMLSEEILDGFLERQFLIQDYGMPYRVDLFILTNKAHSFQNLCVVDGSFSYRMVVIVTKMTSQKLRARVINYRDYKHFNNIRCRKDFLLERNF